MSTIDFALFALAALFLLVQVSLIVVWPAFVVVSRHRTGVTYWPAIIATALAIAGYALL